MANIQEVVLATINTVKTTVYTQGDLNKILDDIGLTSIDYIKFIILIEEKLDIEVPDEFLLFIKTNTIEKLVEMIEKLLNKGIL